MAATTIATMTMTRLTAIQRPSVGGSAIFLSATTTLAAIPILPSLRASPPQFLLARNVRLRSRSTSASWPVRSPLTGASWSNPQPLRALGPARRTTHNRAWNWVPCPRGIRWASHWRDGASAAATPSVEWRKVSRTAYSAVHSASPSLPASRITAVIERRSSRGRRRRMIRVPRV